MTYKMDKKFTEFVEKLHLLLHAHQHGPAYAIPVGRVQEHCQVTCLCGNIFVPESQSCRHRCESRYLKYTLESSHQEAMMQTRV